MTVLLMQASAPEPHSRVRIDLGAIRENYKLLAERSAPAECAVTLKANAYALGMAEIATELYRAGARTYFVAYLSEALELASILDGFSDVKIYVFDGTVPGNEDDYSRDCVLPVLNTLEQVAGWRAYRQRTGAGKSCAVHVNTGMNRLGLPISDFKKLRDNAEGLGVELVLSHLSSADTPNSPQNQIQLERLMEIREQIPAVAFSFCNSSGLFLGKEYVFQLTRPGLALYGANPTPWTRNPMRPALSLQAKLRQVWEISPGETVGYGADFVSDRKMRLGTLAIGYADGYPRSLANSGAYAMFNNIAAPLVGRVSMDFCVVDLSDFGDSAPGPGDWMEVMGAAFTLDDYAQCAGTISHEILTGLGQRLERSYFDSSAQ